MVKERRLVDKALGGFTRLNEQRGKVKRMVVNSTSHDVFLRIRAGDPIFGACEEECQCSGGL